jgi:type I restriction enzyme M protein
VVETFKKIQGLAVKDAFLRKASGYRFYNTSEYTFEKLKADPENIKVNFEAYLNGFSDNVMDILARMDFFTQLERMSNAGLLYQVISDFCTEKADMSPEKISAVDMGYIFENLVQRFSESYDEEAGAHFTSRDIIYLMCDLLTDRLGMAEEGRIYTAYDMAMGTSQMLTCMEERLSALDKAANLICYGQEINPFTFGIAKADMLIRGGDPDNMQFGDTLSDDKFKDMTFDFIISNPPFGIDWKREAAQVEAEHKLGNGGRFAPGLPSKSDGQMLFLMNGIAKLKETGHMAIIQNGSSLFTGDAGSGPSEIRRYIIENDWLDAIVQLPNDSFYNTGIATYIWLVTKNKPTSHREHVQLIDASKCFVPRRKPIGNKRVDITKEARSLIVKAYGEYRDDTFEATSEGGYKLVVKSKILSALSLGYNKITVETPLLDPDGNPVLKKGKQQPDSSKRDTENISLDEDMDEYFAREVLPYNPSAWIDHSKDKVGYEIPFTRTFYEYEMLEPAADIAARIEEHEKVLMEKLQALFGNGGEQCD